MANDTCLVRLRKELRQLQKNPIDNIRAIATEKNMLVWHYVLEGSKGSCYEGGYFHGILTFPASYPYKPPSIQMFTPSGRFKTNTRLCLSISDFHPETWNPLWSVGTILVGLYSFMHEDTPTLGSIQTTSEHRKVLAREALAFNCKNPEFCDLFPELQELFDHQVQSGQYVAQPQSIQQQHTDGAKKALPGVIIAIITFILICTFFIFVLLSA